MAIRDNWSMNAETLTHTLEEFLSDASGAVVIEDGAVMFDLAQAKYSISGEHNKCLLHLWSTVWNTVRRALDAEVKSGTLRLAVQRLGQPQPTKLEICRERDRRSPTAKRGGAGSLRGQAETGHRKTFSRVRDLPPHHPS